MKITNGAGVLLVGGEAFSWRPWNARGTEEGGKEAGEKRLVNEKGLWEVGDAAWGVLKIVWPKPGACLCLWEDEVEGNGNWKLIYGCCRFTDSWRRTANDAAQPGNKKSDQ